MNERGQMVRALKLGETGWALLDARLHIAPAPDNPNKIMVGIMLVGARDNALVDNAPRAIFVHELFRFEPEEAGALLTQADQAARPALDG